MKIFPQAVSPDIVLCVVLCSFGLFPDWVSALVISAWRLPAPITRDHMQADPPEKRAEVGVWVLPGLFFICSIFGLPLSLWMASINAIASESHKIQEGVLGM